MELPWDVSPGCAGCHHDRDLSTVLFVAPASAAPLSAGHHPALMLCFHSALILLPLPVLPWPICCATMESLTPIPFPTKEHQTPRSGPYRYHCWGVCVSWGGLEPHPWGCALCGGDSESPGVTLSASPPTLPACSIYHGGRQMC